MVAISVTEEPSYGYIRVIISGSNSEPMRENTRQAEANRAAKRFKGVPVACLSSGGEFTGNGWELSYTFVPKQRQR